MIEHIAGVKPKVRETLRECPETRDSDTVLYFYYQLRYKGLTVISLDDALRSDHFESISRARRLIQNKEGLYRGTKQIERAQREDGVRYGINKI